MFTLVATNRFKVAATASFAAASSVSLGAEPK
jgi:hypothetical protein